MKKLTAAHPADFNNMNLRDALSYIADAGRLDIVIDERALSEAGVDMVQTQVSMRVQPKPIEQLLSLTLRLATPQLDYSIYNGVVFVSSRDALNRRIVTRIYDVPAKLDREGMLQMISTAVGAARCNVFEDKIVITAPEVAQRDIARLLAQLEPSAQQSSNRGAMFMYGLHNANAVEVAKEFPAEFGKASADERTNSVLITTTDPARARNFVSSQDSTSKDEQALQARINEKKVLHAQADLKTLEERLAQAHVKVKASSYDPQLNAEIEKLNAQITEMTDVLRKEISNRDALKSTDNPASSADAAPRP